MIKRFIIAILFIFVALIIFLSTKKDQKIISSPAVNKESPKRTWQVRSIDTMKYSRDLSLEKINNPAFDQTINTQVKDIKDLNATHVAIGTPYDEKFIPILKRWVRAARDNNLNVWFRGNFSTWQGWFGQPKNLTREQHIEMTRNFIKNNPDLFADGDIFSPCPECENGGPGDPRSQTPVAEYRKFIIEEKNTATEEFKKIGKKVMVLDSMNYDVAKLVMDKDTTKSMGGIILIDHYVQSPQRLDKDIRGLATTAEAKIILGEIGVPIPDIHGNLNPQQQADWMESALSLLKDEKDLLGMNYWVNVGGSTAIINDDNTKKPAAEVIKKYFSLQNLD